MIQYCEPQIFKGKAENGLKLKLPEVERPLTISTEKSNWFKYNSQITYGSNVHAYNLQNKSTSQLFNLFIVKQNII